MRRDPLVLVLLVALVCPPLLGCGDEGRRADACLAEVLPPAEGNWVRAALREGDTTRVIDDGGRSWIVPADPVRVVSTLPGITETVGWLEETDRLVAISPHCDEPEVIRDLPRIAVMPIAWEALTALEPDLVLVDPTLLGGALEEFARRQVPVLPVESRSLAHLATSMDLLADVFGSPRARELARRFQRRLAEALAAARPPPDTTVPRVLLVAQLEPLYVLGPGSLLDDMLRACGAIDVACDLGRASAPFAPELVRARRPDWILTTGEPFPDGGRGRFGDVPAVLQGQVASADADDLVRAGPRTPDGLRRLADVLYGRLPPDALAAPR